MNQGNFLNEMGVFKAAIVRCFEREQKGQSKKACYLEFERLSDKAICSMRFSNPMMASDLFTISRLIKEIKGKLIKVDQLKTRSQTDLIAYLNGFKGECVNIFVRPNTWTTKDGYEKTFYSVEDVINGKYEPAKPAASQEDFEAGFEQDPVAAMSQAPSQSPGFDEDSIPF